MTKTTAPAAAWPTLAVADLITRNVPAAEAAPELVESLAAEGIHEPLYVVTTGSGTVRVVDGMRRLAAAVAAGMDTVPVTYRPVIAVTALAEHPGNVRRDLKISKQLRASVTAEGIRVPIKVTRTDSGLRVVDGHRRLAAAVAEQMTHVPYEYDERDEAGQMLDMVTTAVHREGLSQSEEMTALFEAADLGASVRRMAAASGRTQKEVKTAVRAARSTAVRHATQAQNGGRALTLDELARLADLEERDPEAAKRVTDAITKDPDGSHAWKIQREFTELERRESAAAHRAELEKAGARIRTTAELSPKAVRLYALVGGGDDHETACQGHVWVLEDGDRRYRPYCANPDAFGHKTISSANTSDSKPSSAQRKAIITGNVDWDTAVTLRREWLTGVIGRKTHRKAEADLFTQIAARAMLSGTDVIAGKLTGYKTRAILAQLLGMPEDTDTATIAKKADEAAKRNAAHLFAAVASCYEQAMPRSVWRTDGDHHRHPTRPDAAQYLGWLTELGYEPSAIEAAVIAGETYDPAAEALQED
ncbi:ParB N-terminal domain-containing protein [Streptomyces chryseus]|uniref:ParB N-terminal domain-containing protein n=1 Tax=Streptomyces chryseus TaxID=68186 RepID=UPI00110FC12C|nr:ParB N-terminal domain-containing protein [Streptomyces chryseus]GGX36364.1 hypothetical protein GCM10010353_59240 [Streptomyces chryseus]